MKKTIYVAVIALFGFGALASSPALANCASELDTVAEILKGPNPNAKNNSWGGAQKLLKKAQAAQAAGKKKKCDKLLKKAKGKIEDAKR